MGYIIDPVHLPADLEVGANIGPSFSTSVVTLASGAEEPNRNWIEEILIVDASYGIMAKKDKRDQANSYLAVLDFFRARNGKYRGFLFQDYSDYEARDEPIYSIAATPERFQICKTYGNYIRRITRPRLDTLKVKDKNGNVLGPGAYNVGAKGVLTFNGNVPDNYTCDFNYDVPMRFDTDVLQVSISGLLSGKIPNINLRQVRE